MSIYNLIEDVKKQIVRQQVSFLVLHLCLSSLRAF